MNKECIRRSVKAIVLLGSGACLALSSFATHAQVKSVQITAENAANLIQKGPDAIGGIGDWFLSNGTLCVIISDVDHEGEFSTKGGVVVDLGFCNRDDDHYTTAQDMVDGSRFRSVDTVSISNSNTTSSASVTVLGKTPGVEQTTRYSLDTINPTELKISKHLVRTAEEDQDFAIYSAINFNYHSLEPFVFSSEDLSRSNGFKNEDIVSRGTSALDDSARNADTIITISPPTAENSISYGWKLNSATRIEDDERFEVPHFVLADNEMNAHLIISDTFYIGDGTNIGLVQLPQIPLLSLDEGAALEISESIFVGKNGDVASITDQMLEDSFTISGRVDDSDSALHIDFADGTPLTHVKPLTDGSFSFNAPKGHYVIRHIGSAHRSSTSDFEVIDKPLQLGDLALPSAAKIKLPKGDAMRLVFVGINGTQDPDFIDTYTRFSVIEEDGEHFSLTSRQVFLAGLAGDLEHVKLAPGDYKVYATRGPEFSLETSKLSVNSGSEIELKITTPTRLISTPNYIASDLHVHSGISFDNTFSETERVRTFVAEFGEVMVSSEHDIPVDYAPLIKKMGADQLITSIAAAEVTSLLPTEQNPYTGGHTNFFPYQPQPLEYRRGMVNNEDKRLRDIIHDIRQIEPNVVVQLNHPRQSDRLSGELPSDFEEEIHAGDYLEHMGTAGHPYNPNKPLHSHHNKVLIEKDPATGLRDIDFDLIEVINPGGPDHESRLRAVRKDWLSFVKQGERIVGTANSDSHDSAHQVAVPRTMVAVENDSVANFNQTEFLRSLKAGNAYGTTGPMLKVSLSGAEMGETFIGQRGQLSLQVSSVNWIHASTVKIQINGETVSKHTLPDKPVNNLLIPVSFDKDSFVTVEVFGDASEDYANVYPEITPYAFSNPIYVEFEGDDKWVAPGL